MLRVSNETTVQKEYKILMYEFSIIIRLMDKMFEEDVSLLAKKVDLTFPQYFVLLIIDHEEGLLVSKIAKIGRWHVSTVMSLLERLLEKGLIKLEPVKRGKGSYVFLTDLGRKTITQEIDAPPPHIVKFMHSMGFEAVKKNLKMYHRVMDKVFGEKYMDEIREYLNKAREKIGPSID